MIPILGSMASPPCSVTSISDCIVRHLELRRTLGIVGKGQKRLMNRT
jgi:hypothetical protein